MQHSTSCACGVTPLALERTPEGWVQRATFSHPDLHEELVEELAMHDSPLARSASVSGVVSFTFLLLGDQNAGKSTFLHAFTHAGDRAWLELLSWLPILSSSFVNAQLALSADSSGRATPIMDEPPFLDTDVGRGTLLLTLEDFAFFVAEFALPVPREALERLAAADGVRYASIELIEIGGDHLDRMMARRNQLQAPSRAPFDAAAMDTTAPPASLAFALRRSEELLGASHASVYFLNGTSLLHLIPTSVDGGTEKMRLRLVLSAFESLIARMEYLTEVLPRGQRIRIHLCRVPPSHAPFEIADVHALVDALNARAPASSALHAWVPLEAGGVVQRAHARVAAHAARMANGSATATGHATELPEEMAAACAPPPPHVSLLGATILEVLKHALCSGIEGSGAIAELAMPPSSASAASQLRLEDVHVLQTTRGTADISGSGSGANSSGGGGGSGDDGGVGVGLDVPMVIGTLVQLFDGDCLHRPPPPPVATAILAAAGHLLQCFKDVSRRLTSSTHVGTNGTDPTSTRPLQHGKRGRGVNDATTPSSRMGDALVELEVWLTRPSWEEYLADEPPLLEVPVNALIESFAPLVRRMCEAGLAIRYHSHGHADLSLRVEVDGADGTRTSEHEWSPQPSTGGNADRAEPQAAAPAAVAAMAEDVSDEAVVGVTMMEDEDEDEAVRFPYCAALLEAIEGPLAAGLPAVWWVGEGTGDESTGTGGEDALSCARVIDAAAVWRAEAVLRARLQEQLSLRLSAESSASWHTMVMLLEEWCLAHTLLRRIPGGGGTMEAMDAPFRLRLRAPGHVGWRSALAGHMDVGRTASPSGPSRATKTGTRTSRPTSMAHWRVELVIAEEPEAMCVSCED